MTEADAFDPGAAVRALADELTKQIRLARALVESGRAVDLAGFDRRVGLLCAKSLDLTPAAGRDMRAQLITLLRSVEALSLTLTARVAPFG